MASKFPENSEDERHMLRLSDMIEEPQKMLMPLKGYENVPLVSLEEAVEPLVPLVDDVRRMAWTAKQKCEEPADGLSCDESASIMLYSMEWEPHERCLYVVLNAKLREPNRRGLTPWFLYLRLILTALSRLPSIRLTIYRGIKLDLSAYYKKNTKFVWWGFSSCTRNIGVLENEQFLGKSGERTIFNVTAYSGKNVRNHSYFETEDEVLLLPARQFTVVSILNPAHGLHIIQIDEVEPEFPLLEPLPMITYYSVPSLQAPMINKHIVKSDNIKTPRYTYDSFAYAESYSKKVKCRHGGECWYIDDKIHSEKYDHPSYCLEAGSCDNMNPIHSKQFRHLPLCKYALKCIAYLKADPEHCKRYRHCQPLCPYENNCIYFHNKEHLKDLKHLFVTPCPLTPFHCASYTQLSEAADTKTIKEESVQQHCLDFSHVCRFGRQCKTDAPLHKTQSIHIIRCMCPYDGKCKKLNQDEHLNSYTHTSIADIRRVCPHADRCHDIHKLEHIAKYSHARSKEDIGVVHLYSLNIGINFARNLYKNNKRVFDFIKKQGWKPLPGDTIPIDILNYFRTVQPVHRCAPFIFESILLHGHVMSRDYMENLRKPKFVATSVMQHARVRRIDGLRIPQYTKLVRDYITETVSAIFDAADFPPVDPAAPDSAAPSHRLSPEEHDKNIKKAEKLLTGTFSTGDLDVLKRKAKEIATASIELHTNPAGIGHAPDKAFGTHKRVFSILGPHLGHYYGDVFIVFKREILHHPDADFSMCAATTFGPSGNAYKWRPWLTDPADATKRIDHYHNTKYHASIPGFEYAIALELMAITSLDRNLKSMDMNLETIFKRWLSIDSHLTIEAHLPQLIPIDYIDHIYVSQNIYDSFSDLTRQTLNAAFKNCYTILKHPGLVSGPSFGSAGPKPKDQGRLDYQTAVINALMEQYKRDITYGPVRPIRGAVITILPSGFTELSGIPLTISQAYELYQSIHNKKPSQNIVYIYWQTINGDMMLVLSKEQVELKDDQPNDQCLLCYISPKNDSYGDNYHEQTTYINKGQPIQHHKFLNKNLFKAKSNYFHMGSNINDYITYCLELDCSSGKVALYQAGPNAIYNYQKLVCDFGKHELDLSTLEYIYVTADAKEVSVRNLFATFEKQADLHPTIDLNFNKNN